MKPQAEGIELEKAGARTTTGTRAGGRDAGLTGGERSELRTSGTNQKAVARGEQRAKEGPCKPSTLRKREEKEMSRGEGGVSGTEPRRAARHQSRGRSNTEPW